MSTTTAVPTNVGTSTTAAGTTVPTAATGDISPVAAVYVRISSDPKGERAGVERQRADCERLAADLGVTDVRLYEDNDRSAFSGTERPAFTRMLADVADGQVSTVIVWAVDRLYRRLTDLERIVSVLDAAGVSVHAVKSGDLDLSTADGRLHARLLGSVAAHESEKKSERIKARARQRATVERRTVASNKPFGWRFIDGNGGGLEPDPVKAPALAQAYRDVLDGLSLYAAHKRLSAIVDVGKMTSGTLGTILRNPRNGGYASYKGEITGEAADGQRIVDADTFDRVAAILSDPSRRTSPGRPTNTMLGGILVCGVCGGPMSASKRQSRGVKVAVYICSRNKHMTRRRALIDPPILSMAADVLAALGARGLLAQAPAEDTRAHELRQRIADAEHRLDALAAMVAGGDLNPADFGKAAAKIRTGMEADSAALAARAQRPALVKLAAADDVRATWQAAVDADDTATVRSILSEVVDTITCRPDRSAVVAWAGWTGLQSTMVNPPGELTMQGRAARRERVGQLHAAGRNISQIATEFGISRQTVRNDLDAMGLTNTSQTSPQSR